jgi:hypothetical protein
VVAATHLTGGMNEAAARLPSAVAGLAAVVLVLMLGRRLYDLRTGVIAGFILATSFSFVFYSRLADADVETIAGELAALLLFWRNQDRRASNWIFALWLIMALTSLTKGLLGFILPILVIGLYCMWRDGLGSLSDNLRHGALYQRLQYLIERQTWFFNRRTPFALALAGLIYYAPFAISHAATGSSQGIYMVYRENVERYFEPFDHKGPLYLYCYVIFILMAPWSAFLPAALINAHATEEADTAKTYSKRFVLTFFWGTFFFFTLSGSRRSYYILPILPAAALLIARLIVESPLRSRMVNLALRLGFAVIVAIAIVCVLVIAPPRYFLPHPYNILPPAPYRLVFALCWIVSVAVLGSAIRQFSPIRMFLATGIAAALFMFYLFIFAYPAGDAWRGEKRFASDTRAIIGNNTDQLALFRNAGPVYYLGLPKPIPLYSQKSDLDAAVNADRIKWIIVRVRDLGLLPTSSQVVVREAIFPWDSNGHRLNSMVLVHVVTPTNS